MIRLRLGFQTIDLVFPLCNHSICKLREHTYGFQPLIEVCRPPNNKDHPEKPFRDVLVALNTIYFEW